MEGVNVMTLNRNQASVPKSPLPPGSDVARRGDDFSGFDLRDALAEMTVRETSFSEFLAALRLQGKHPA